ncbi:MAG TPA: zinc ribbon domain-containing protein, partial [Thermoleophilia bacterium]|nr:zinc ribbon domain-containing protein [Thermoleophilia bacterium]
MYCQDCGVEVPQDSVFCQHCGARLPEAPDTGAGRRPGTRTFLGDPADPSAYVTPTSGSIPGMPPYAGPPPTGESSGSRSGNSTPQPRRAGGNRTLLIAVVVAVALFMLAVPLGLMALLTTTRESSGTSDPVSVSSGEDTVTTAPSDGDSTSSTSGSGPPGSGSTQGVAPDYASSDWEELELPGLPEQTYSAITSDVAAAFETKSGLYAYIYETGKLVHLPTEMNAASSVSIDGDRMVWWEGDYDESDTLTREGIFSYRLPDGPRVELLTGGESAGSPLLSDGYVTWLEGRESADHPQDIWELPIYGAALDAGGRLQGEPQSLVENPRSYVLGDSTWSYDLTPDYLAWEDNDPADGSQPGTWVLDR